MIESKRAVIIINYIKRHITQTIYKISDLSQMLKEALKVLKEF